jgi:hypothetical protein
MQGCADVLALAGRLLAADGVDLAGYKLVLVENLIADACVDVWRLTFKPLRLLPADAESMIGAGGELFIEVDARHGRINAMTRGE